MTKATLLLFFCWLTLFIKFSNAVDEGCNFYQDLMPGTTYYIYNNEYPSFYQGAQSCMWILKSDYRVNLTCSAFELPWSYDCNQDNLAIQISPNNTHRYCGDGSFNLQSEGDTMTVLLSTPYWSTGGRFLCEAQTIARPGDTDENCRCGWKNPTRIVGGTETGVNEYPMMAGLVDSIQRTLFCGATVISSKYAITAAHCTIRRSSDELGVVVGEHDTTRNNDTTATRLYRVSEIHVHPNYVQTQQLNDIAVVKVIGSIGYSNEVGPACLPFQHSPDTFGGDYVYLLGWGLTDFGGPKATVLQKVKLSVLTPIECSKSYPNVNANQICTYAPGKDACQMDSGGPVLWQNPTSRRLVLTGIISFGGVCGLSPGVNTRVGGYTDWIVSVTPDATYCIIE